MASISRCATIISSHVCVCVCVRSYLCVQQLQLYYYYYYYHRIRLVLVYYLWMIQIHIYMYARVCVCLNCRFEAGIVHVAHVSDVVQFSRGSAQRKAAGRERRTGWTRRWQGLSIRRQQGDRQQRFRQRLQCQPADAGARPGRRAQSALPSQSKS